MTTPLRIIIPGGDGQVGSIFSRHFHAQGNEINVRKIALRSAMVMSPDRGGIFDMLLRLVRLASAGRRATVNNSFRGFMTLISNLLSNS